MSGNAWEWVSDKYAKYGNGPQVNPYITAGGIMLLGTFVIFVVIHDRMWEKLPSDYPPVFLNPALDG